MVWASVPPGCSLARPLWLWAARPAPAVQPLWPCAHCAGGNAAHLIQPCRQPCLPRPALPPLQVAPDAPITLPRLVLVARWGLQCMREGTLQGGPEAGAPLGQRHLSAEALELEEAAAAAGGAGGGGGGEGAEDPDLLAVGACEAAEISLNPDGIATLPSLASLGRGLTADEAQRLLQRAGAAAAAAAAAAKQREAAAAAARAAHPPGAGAAGALLAGVLNMVMQQKAAALRESSPAPGQQQQQQQRPPQQQQQQQQQQGQGLVQRPAAVRPAPAAAASTGFKLPAHVHPGTGPHGSSLPSSQSPSPLAFSHAGAAGAGPLPPTSSPLVSAGAQQPARAALARILSRVAEGGGPLPPSPHAAAAAEPHQEASQQQAASGMLYLLGDLTGGKWARRAAWAGRSGPGT